MRNSIKFLACIFIAVTLVACGESEAVNEDVEVEDLDVEEESEETVADESSSDEDQDQPLEVDKGLLNVEVVIPASLVEDQDIDQTIQEAKESGISEVTKNEDGSLTYKMSRSAHSEMLSEMEVGLRESIEDMKNSADYSSIVDISANSSFDEFTMTVDQEAFENSFDGFAALGLAFGAMFYQLFDGVDPDDYSVTIHFENVDTGEVFDTVVYPDAFEE